MAIDLRLHIACSHGTGWFNRRVGAPLGDATRAPTGQVYPTI